MSLHRAAAEVRARTALSRRHALGICILAVAILPPVYAFASGGIEAIFSYFAADAFVYLSVAANSHAGFYTFDGVHPTNGFHPLWQMLLQGIFQASGIRAAKGAQLVVAYGLSVALVTGGCVLVAQAVLRWTGSLLAATLTFPGLFGAVMLLCGWPAGTMWSYMNGMESPASLCLFGFLLLYLSQPERGPLIGANGIDRRRLLVLSLLCAGIVLSRLDDMFLPAIVAIWIVLHRQAPPAVRAKALLWFALPIGAALLAYLAFNAATVGHAMPISGAAKFDIRTPLLNLGLLGSSLHDLIPDALYDPFHADSDLSIADVNWRNAQMLVPVIAARILLANMQWLSDDRAGRFATWMRLLLIYVIAKGTYNFLFVPLIHQGHWYYPLSIATVNVAASVALARLCAARAERNAPLGRLAAPAAMLGTALVLAMFVHGRSGEDAGRYLDLFRSGPQLAETLRSLEPEPRIVEADDGILNYALGLPTMSGFLFAIDPGAYRAYRERRFLAEASARGYRLIGSLYYLRNVPTADLTPAKIPGILRERLFNATEWDLEDFDFALAYRDDRTGAVFIRFTPKP